MIDEIAQFAPGVRAADLTTISHGELPEATAYSDQRLAVLERLAELRNQLVDRTEQKPSAIDGDSPLLSKRALGAAPEAPIESESQVESGGDLATWSRAIESTERELATLWDSAFCGAVQQQLSAGWGAPLPELIAAVGPQLDWLNDMTDRLTAIRNSPSELKTLAISSRLNDLLTSLFDRLENVDRQTLSQEIGSALELLSRAGLAQTVSADQWLTWASSALLRFNREQPAPTSGALDYEGYRRMRDAEPRTPIVYALCEVALQVAPEIPRHDTAPRLTEIAALFAQLSAPLRQTVAEFDLTRIEGALDYLERWWQQLCEGELTAQKRLDTVVRSQFFDVLWDDSALARFTLEARLVADLLPESRDQVARQAERLSALQQRTHRGAFALLRQRTDAAWRAALAAK